MLKKIVGIFDKNQKRNLVFLFFVMFIGGFFEMLGISMILPLVEAITDPKFTESVPWAKMVCQILGIASQRAFVLTLLGTLIAVYIVKNVYIIMMYSLQYRFVCNNQRRLSVRLMTSYVNQSYLFHISKNSAELHRNVTIDVEHFFATVLNCIQLISEGITCVFLCVVLLLTDFSTAMGAAIIIGLFSLGFYYCYKKVSVKNGEKYREADAENIKWIHQALGGIKQIKVMNREQFFIEHYDMSYMKIAGYMRKQNLIQVIPKPILESGCICSLLLVMVVQIVMGAEMQSFIPVLSVFALAAFRMLPSFNRITAYLSAIMFYKPAVDAVYQDLREAEEFGINQSFTDTESGEMHLENSITVHNVSFSYPNTEKMVLKNVNLEIPAHKSVALIGPSGSGKTTLADIILGVLPPVEGSVYVDNTDIFQNLQGWHKMVGYIPQSIYLMDDSIRNNITFGIQEEQVDEAEVWRALREAQLEDFVKSLEDGLDTMVGEMGVRLSGGQRQRIGIARALYCNPKVLVLDEATSALDNETETAVMEAIDSLQGEKTMIIIAHRLTTIRNCDFIYEIDGGTATRKRKEDIL